ncbi:hypothetical protein ITJ38_17990 [Agreia pratensis]|uniref:hypothetical protein n=1 Tax=Agreia pratensis TaxID=150121 RepID=UPI00188A2DE8|nr:hypothetical protein [Agreia pratensis]MBF4636305.1 hypothetical protein [Agreia pratensis]
MTTGPKIGSIGFQLSGAWPNQEQTVEGISQATVAIAEFIAAVSPVEFEWYANGSTTPLNLVGREVAQLVAGGVWRHSVTNATDPSKGYSVTLTGWKSGLPADEWAMVVSLSIAVGNTTSVARNMWPNSVSMKIGDLVPEAEALRLGAAGMTKLVDSWPVAWARFESFPLRREAVGPVGQPSTTAGLMTWISTRLAQVPASVPHCRVTDLGDGVLVTMDEVPRQMPSASILSDVNEFLKRSGSLPDIPAEFGRR